MSRQMHSKSSLFLTEIIIDILLFTILCACGLLFFVKSTRLTQNSTDLYQGARLCSQVASIYESGDGTFSTLEAAYKEIVYERGEYTLYFDENYNPCLKAIACSYLRVVPKGDSLNTIDIQFYNLEGELKYSIFTCCYSPSTLEEVKEDSHE